MRRKREREILHNYMEVLARNYENMEPNIMSDSICEIYKTLNRPSDRVVPWLIISAIVYSFVGITVLFVNLFRRKA